MSHESSFVLPDITICRSTWKSRQTSPPDVELHPGHHSPLRLVLLMHRILPDLLSHSFLKNWKVLHQWCLIIVPYNSNICEVSCSPWETLLGHHISLYQFTSPCWFSLVRNFLERIYRYLRFCHVMIVLITFFIVPDGSPSSFQLLIKNLFSMTSSRSVNDAS